MITFFDSFKGSESKSMLMHTSYKNLHNRTIKTWLVATVGAADEVDQFSASVFVENCCRRNTAMMASVVSIALGLVLAAQFQKCYIVGRDKDSEARLTC